MFPIFSVFLPSGAQLLGAATLSIMTLSVLTQHNRKLVFCCVFIKSQCADSHNSERHYAE